MDWQPIETAPKDGQRIVAWRGAPVIIRWVEKFAEIYGDTSEGWYEPELDRRAYPTHWIPLPAPSKDSRDG